MLENVGALMRDFGYNTTSTALEEAPPTTAGNSTDAAWAVFKNQFKKSYSSDSEETLRKSIFLDALARIEKHNQEDSQYTLAANQLADLTEAEWKARYTGAIPPPKSANLSLGIDEEQVELADSVDWAAMGALNPVQNQGVCQSCWAFSSTAALESAHQIASGQLVLLSKQQLVDCAYPDGCMGGWQDEAFDYAAMAGMCTESSYIYQESEGRCESSSCTLALQPGVVKGFMTVARTSSALMSALMSHTVSTYVYATGDDFGFYESGVLTGECTGFQNHAVLTVGYGTLNGTPYWRIRNSWGEQWGERGYGNLARGVSGDGAYCILQDEPHYPILDVENIEVKDQREEQIHSSPPPPPHFWPQLGEDSVKCIPNSTIDDIYWRSDEPVCVGDYCAQNVPRRSDCQTVAEAAGHAFYSLRRNHANMDGLYQCVSTARCEFIVDTQYDWAVYSAPLFFTT